MGQDEQKPLQSWKRHPPTSAEERATAELLKQVGAPQSLSVEALARVSQRLRGGAERRRVRLPLFADGRLSLLSGGVAAVAVVASLTALLVRDRSADAPTRRAPRPEAVVAWAQPPAPDQTLDGLRRGQPPTAGEGAPEPAPGSGVNERNAKGFRGAPGRSGAGAQVQAQDRATGKADLVAGARSASAMALAPPEQAVLAKSTPPNAEPNAEPPAGAAAGVAMPSRPRQWASERGAYEAPATPAPAEAGKLAKTVAAADGVSPAAAPAPGAARWSQSPGSDSQEAAAPPTLAEVERWAASGRCAEAIGYFTRWSEGGPADRRERAGFGLGHCELELGHRDEGQAALRRYLARFPKGRFAAQAQALLDQSVLSR